jgi:hypothetical protein
MVRASNFREVVQQLTHELVEGVFAALREATLEGVVGQTPRPSSAPASASASSAPAASVRPGSSATKKEGATKKESATKKEPAEARAAKPPRDSVNQRLVTFLDERVGEAFAAQDVAGALGRADKLRSIAAALSGLVGRGLVKRSGAGRYTSRKTVVTESMYPAASNTLVSDPQLLLAALERGETPEAPTKTPDSATYARKPARDSIVADTPADGATDAAAAPPARREKEARGASTAEQEAAPPPAEQRPRPPRLEADEKTTQTASGAYVIRRRRASAA